MSNVHKRLRKETELQFLVSAQNLQVELTKFIMSEKNMPKKYRYIIGLGLINKVDELVDNLTAANTIYPTNSSEYKQRVYYQTQAIINCWQLHNKIVRIILCIDTAKIQKLEKVAELLVDTEGLIKQWKKSDKERYKLFVEKL